MSEELFDGDGRIVETELALLAELHDGSGGEELGVGSHAEAGGCRDWGSGDEVAMAVALGSDELLIVNDADGDTGQMLVDHLVAHPGVEQTDGCGNVRVVNGCGGGAGLGARVGLRGGGALQNRPTAIRGLWRFGAGVFELCRGRSGAGG